VNLGSKGDSMEPTRKQPPSAIYEEVDSLATNVGSSPIARSTSSSVRFRRLQILSDEESRGRITASCCGIPRRDESAPIQDAFRLPLVT